MYFGQGVGGHVVMAWLGFGMASLGGKGNKDILAGIKMHNLLAAKDNSL